jgi:hypothetical protein
MFTMLKQQHSAEVFLANLQITAAAAVVAGAFVWLGTFVGVRWSPMRQRTNRLARLLALMYLVCGIALGLPIKTHAVKVDMPQVNDDSGLIISPPPKVVAAGVLLLMFVLPVALARGAAALCAVAVDRDA